VLLTAPFNKTLLSVVLLVQMKLHPVRALKIVCKKVLVGKSIAVGMATAVLEEVSLCA